MLPSGVESRTGMLHDTVRRLARRSYALTKWRLLRRMERQRGVPVVVFCMSKTASSAVVRAVREAVPQPVFKIHLLAPASVAEAEARYRSTDPAARPKHIFHAAHLLRHMPTPDAPWTVITIVREPIGRSASDFFQSGRRLNRLGDEASTKAAFERFATTQGIPRTTEWFERELQPTLGIDVYAHPFDAARGHTVIETPAVRMLVLRHESIHAASAALGGFLGLPGDLELEAENVGRDKEYKELYESVLRDVRFPADALELAYGSRFARHFYSEAEIDAFRERWGQAPGR